MLATANLLKAAPTLRRGITTAQLDIVRATLPAVAEAVIVVAWRTRCWDSAGGRAHAEARVA